MKCFTSWQYEEGGLLTYRVMVNDDHRRTGLTVSSRPKDEIRRSRNGPWGGAWMS